MKVSITGHLTHLCPYVDEVDVGTFTIEYDHTSEFLIELHEFNTFLNTFHDERISHEALTIEISAYYPFAAVSTTWLTAGLTITCSEGPRT